MLNCHHIHIHNKLTSYLKTYIQTGTNIASSQYLISAHCPSAVTQLQVSWNDGLTWKAYCIDSTAIEGQGSMVELAPEVVLFLYGSPHGGLRQQHIQVTPEGIAPITASKAQRLVESIEHAHDEVLDKTSIARSDDCDRVSGGMHAGKHVCSCSGVCSCN